MTRTPISSVSKRDLPQDFNFYDAILQKMADRQLRSVSGSVVIKRQELEPSLTRNGKYWVYVHDVLEDYYDVAITDWRIFAHEIHKHTGRHTHQGGIVLYVTKGSGYTEVAGEKKHWKAGDLLLLPILPGGVEHKHWNDSTEEPAEWVAFRFIPFMDALGAELKHQEDSPAGEGEQQ